MTTERLTTMTTPRESDLLVFLRTYISRHGYAPTQREMAAGIGLPVPSLRPIHRLLDGLEAKRLIVRDYYQTRGVRITEATKQV